MNVKIVLYTGLLVFSSQTTAFEAYQSSPGSRAMSMAGVFSAQANDSSAIWYNPAGLAMMSSVQGDATLELATLPSRKLDSDEVDGIRYDNTASTLKYAAAATNKIPFVDSSTSKFSSGISLYKPYSLKINIDKSTVFDQPDSNDTFGIIDTDYLQFSAALAHKLSSRFYLGGTVDALWSEVSCQNSEINCVKNGPTGYGMSVGVLFKLYSSTHTQVQLASVWRSKADLKYSNKPNSPVSLSAAVEEYLPDRPESRNLGINLQLRLNKSLVNINVGYEQTLWSDVDGVHQPITDYTKYGVSAEWTIASQGSQWNTAIRGGFSIARPEDPDISEEFNVIALGLGLGVNRNMFFDLALEQRKLDESEDDTVKLVSASYSFQFD